MSNPLSDLKPVDDDLLKRMLQFEIDCDDGQGNAYACHSVAEFHAVIKNDHAKAAEVLEKNCDGKNKYAASCFKLGRFLIMGKGVEANDALAFKRFEQACSGNLSQGCFHLGSMLVEGTVVKDPKRAMSVFGQACASGDAESCYRLGRSLLKSSGPAGPRDPALAKEHLAAACDLHAHAPSCRMLAVMFKNGDGPVSRDEAKFLEYKQRTADLVQQRGAMMGVRVTKIQEG